jgi:hypothetical protein
MTPRYRSPNDTPHLPAMASLLQDEEYPLRVPTGLRGEMLLVV